jgi:glycine/sarcosine N-methyltransferase
MTGRHDPRDFYDGLAEHYHLIYADWAASIERQAAALDRVITAALGEGPHSVLDCTCGIGTQALGLARLGHRVTGTDLSPGAVERARTEARGLGLDIAFDVADVRQLDTAIAGAFDVVLSGDNSLPHLPSDADLRRAVRQMLARVRPGGLLLASTRDYDELLTTRPTSTPAGAIGPPGERRLSFQLWEWDDDGRGYDLELFILTEGPDGWTTRSWLSRYRAITRAELSAIIHDEGGTDIRWLMPEESGFFQPLLVATGPGPSPV